MLLHLASCVKLAAQHWGRKSTPSVNPYDTIGSAKTKDILLNGLQPGHHGPQPEKTVIRLDRNRLLRNLLVLTGAGVSQRNSQACLEEMLDTRVSVGWVNGRLAELEAQATQVNHS